jgi:hypothetical protein
VTLRLRPVTLAEAKRFFSFGGSRGTENTITLAERAGKLAAARRFERPGS